MTFNTTTCPQCLKNRMPEKNKYCSRKCFNEHYGYEETDSITKALKVAGMYDEESS